MEEKKDLQYRYYDMPIGTYVMALFGKGWVREYGSDAPWMHFHNYLEIGYCHDGTGEIFLGDVSYTYYPKTFTIIPANFPHNTMSKPGTTSFWEYLFVDISGFLNSIYENNPHVCYLLVDKVESNSYFLKQEEHKQMGDLIQGLINCHRYKEEFYKESEKGLLLALIVDIARLSRRIEFEQEATKNDTKIIVEALKFVDKNFKEQIKISEMAEACHLSETHFRRVFGQRMGISPLAYINLVRVEAACKMMRTTGTAIKETAMKCGFLTLPSFNRNFKKLMGVTPMDWRKSKEISSIPKNKSNIVFNGWL